MVLYAIKFDVILEERKYSQDNKNFQNTKFYLIKS